MIELGFFLTSSTSKRTSTFLCTALRIESRDQLAWNTKFSENSPKEFSRYFIKSLDQIEEENTSLLVVFSPFGHEQFDCESTVCAPIPEATICILYIQACRPKKSYLFGHLFFNITNAFCAKTKLGHACICPRMVTA